MATYNTLTSLLSAIAAAIKNKTGNSASINAQDFPAKIESIMGGATSEIPSLPKVKGIAYLGNGTSFDVKSKCNSLGVNYTTLTANNFVFLTVTTKSASASNDLNGQTNNTVQTSLVKSYDQSSGVLSAYIQGQAWTSGSWGNSANPTVNSPVDVYMIY